MGEGKDRREAATRAAMDTTGRAISVIHRNALGVAGLIGVQDAKEVPRLCIAAGLRTVELMLEEYRNIKAGEAETRANFVDDPHGLSVEQQIGMYELMLTERREQILAALKDAEAALAEGHEAVISLGQAIVGPKVTLQ